jgi:OOP family OmpA-OmpF porin
LNKVETVCSIFAQEDRKMGLFDGLIDDIKSRFSLGSQAVPLIQKLLGLIIGDPGGIESFLDKFRANGLAPQVSSWLGNPDSAALPPHCVEQALGGAVGAIAQKLRLKNGIVASTLGYATPKMIGLLTPGGVVPTSIPASVLSFLETPATGRPSSGAEQNMFRRVESPPPLNRRGEDTAGINRWIFPGLAAFLAIGFVMHFLSTIK